MRRIRSVASMQRLAERLPQPIVLVPTMGALHHGHEALIEQARRIAGRRGTVVASIYVNPAQFGPDEDFEAYPRPIASDLTVCRRAGADVAFTPEVAEMSPPDASVFVDEAGLLSGMLCGRSRPGHFRGVCSVVAKLFHIVRPEHAIFGEKDWQQLAIIRRMVRDLAFPIKIHGHPTVREIDGLAVSSRNAYLLPEERAVAPGIYAALKDAASAGGGPKCLRASALAGIGRIPGARVDYVEVVEAATLAAPHAPGQPLRLIAAVFLGRARLIDQVAVEH